MEWSPHSLTGGWMLRNLPSPVLVVGPAHSGKSELALSALAQNLETTVFGAASPEEPAFQARIAKLKALRPAHWQHEEKIPALSSQLAAAAQKTPQILLDSLSQHLGHLLIDSLNRYSRDQAQALIEAEVDHLCQWLSRGPGARIVIVSSEVGAAAPPSAAVPRLYRELVGRANQMVAAAVPVVVMVSCGIPQILKAP